jgi:hypothetical protein
MNADHSIPSSALICVHPRSSAVNSFSSLNILQRLAQHPEEFAED